MTERKIKCERCGYEFVSGWSEEEAHQEKVELWGDLPKDQSSVVCDDCFKAFMKWYKQAEKRA